MINFTDAKRVPQFGYGGEAGAKFAIEHNGDIWMLKLPKSTRDMINPQISYTTSPLSEYLGSKIYESLGLPVHETILGFRGSKIVVACKDFTLSAGKQVAILRPFNELKNSFMATDIDSYSGSGSETLLGEVLDTLAGEESLGSIEGATERFWDMFVVDAFIGNNDRNNGNWGLLRDLKTGELTLAPVFDNGNAFFNKKGIPSMKERTASSDLLQNDAYRSFECVYKYENDGGKERKINPFKFIKQIGENTDCDAAVVRFMERIDMNKVTQVINDVPETFGHVLVMPQEQKEYYLKIMQLRLDEVLRPTSEKIKTALEKDHSVSLTDVAKDVREASAELASNGSTPPHGAPEK